MAYQYSGLFNATDTFVVGQSWNYLTHIWGNKGFHGFAKGNNSELNVIPLLGFEFAYL